jgi:hypothetical protein
VNCESPVAGEEQEEFAMTVIAGSLTLFTKGNTDIYAITNEVARNVSSRSFISTLIRSTTEGVDCEKGGGIKPKVVLIDSLQELLYTDSVVRPFYRNGGNLCPA